MYSNVLWYGDVREYETISYQFTLTFFTNHKRSHTTETRMHYTMCCVFGIFNIFFYSSPFYDKAFIALDAIQQDYYELF